MSTPTPINTASPTAATKTPLQPSAQFMLRHPAHIIAQGFGSGLSPIMPGTMGTLFGWLVYALLTSYFPALFTAQTWGVVIVVSFIIGVWACQVTGRNLGTPDHGSMVWDEIIAIWIVLLFITPADVRTQCWAFFWFRFFDMLKPPPISYFDRRFKGGFGVMFDDIVAAFFVLLMFALWLVM